MGLMVISDFDFVRSVCFPDEADSPLIVDANGMLPFAVSFEGFESVAGRNGEMFEFSHCVELSEFSQSHALDVRWKAAGFSFVKKRFGVFA